MENYTIPEEMRRLFYFILLIAGFSSIHSCKDMLDENGDPLLDLNDNSGLIGPRALYREITDADTLAEYHYSGLLLTKVITDSASITDVMYSGEKISKITFNGFLTEFDTDNLRGDSISYSQLFTYGPTGRLETISENRSIFRRPAIVPPATTPNPQTLIRKTKSLYNLKYSGNTSKLDSIIMRTGIDAPSVPFTEYSKTGFTYVGDNISTTVRHYGPIVAGGAFSAATEKYTYRFSDYDTKISGYTLLPKGYKISALLATKRNDRASYKFSPNSPKRMSVTDDTAPIPTPVSASTDYNYDPQTYVTKGFGINYIYKPL